MSNLLHSVTSLPTPFNMVVLIVLISAVAGVCATIIKQLGAYAQQRQELAFKRELIDRGMSADEIEQVTVARSAPATEKPTVVHAQQYFAGET